MVPKNMTDNDNLYPSRPEQAVPVYPTRLIEMHRPGESQGMVLDGNTAIMDPSEIGLGANYVADDGSEVPFSVIAVGTIGEGDDARSFAVTKAGNSWQLHGLKARSNGSRYAVNILNITEGGYTLGRQADATPHANDNGVLLTAKDLWSADQTYGKSISGIHLSMGLRNGQLGIIDRGSLNGTRLEVADTNADRRGKVASSLGAPVIASETAVRPEWDRPNSIDIHEQGPFDTQEKELYSSLVRLVAASKPTEQAINEINKLWRENPKQVSDRFVTAANVLAATGLPTDRENVPGDVRSAANRLRENSSLPDSERQHVEQLVGYVQEHRRKHYSDAAIAEALEPMVWQILQQPGVGEAYKAALLAVLAGAERTGGIRSGRSELEQYMRTGKLERMTLINPEDKAK